MLRQIYKLTGLQLCNLFGLNEFRHTKDQDRKQHSLLLALAWLLVIGVILFYIAVLSFGMIALGIPDIIPVYLYMITSLIILVFSFLKAGSVLFQMKSYEMLISLPLSKSAIVISRFLSMYVTNLGMSLCVLLTGMIVYGISVHPSPLFYLYGFIGALFLPLLPMTLSTAAGAFITAIGSRMKYKNLAIAGLTLLLAMGVIAANFGLQSQSNQITADMLRNLTDTITVQIQHIYPPAIWFGHAVIHKDLLSLVMLIGISLLIFILMVLLVQRSFTTICTALNTTSAKNNYKLKSLTASSSLKALWFREIKRYLASNVYISNTLIGYLLMPILPVSLKMAGIEAIENTLGYPGILRLMLPLFLGAIAAIMPMTAVSLSMEGKNWWLMKSLPIDTRTILKGKILAHLTVVSPFYVISVVLSAILLKPEPQNILWLIVLPAAFILFSSVSGLSVNLKFPVFNWENEARVVKQSASVLVTMLMNFLVCLPPLFFLFLLKALSPHMIYGLTLILLLILTVLLYQSNNRRDLLSIG